MPVGTSPNVLCWPSAQVIFRSQKFAVFKHIPDLQIVVTAWTGVQHVGNRFLPPGPEGGADHIVRQGQVDVDPRCSISPHSRTAALHDPVILAHSVVETVEHPARLIQVANEDVITVRIVEPPDFRLWQFRLVELASIAGRFRQGTHRAISEVVLIVSAYICDDVVGSIVAADHIAHPRDVLRTVLRDVDGTVRIFVECGLADYRDRRCHFIGLVRVDGDGIGGGVVGDAEPHCLSDIPGVSHSCCRLSRRLPG